MRGFTPRVAVGLGLLHGFGATAFTWRAIVEPLSTVHSVTVLDRPWGPLDQQVRATVQSLERDASGDWVLVGHSGGAEVALGVGLRGGRRRLRPSTRGARGGRGAVGDGPGGRRPCRRATRLDEIDRRAWSSSATPTGGSHRFPCATGGWWCSTGAVTSHTRNSLRARHGDPLLHRRPPSTT